MQIELWDIVFAAVLFTQLTIGAIAWWNLRNMQGRFGHPLGSKVTVVEMLQKYSRIFTPLNIRVDVGIKMPAQVQADTLLVNKRMVYHTGLFTNFYTLFQILLLLPAYGLLLKVRRTQIVLFLIEIAVYVASFYVFKQISVISVFIGLVLLVTGFVYQSYLSDILADTLDVAKDILELDNVEESRAKVLVSEMQSDAFIYPWEIVKWVIDFLNPFGRSTP